MQGLLSANFRAVMCPALGVPFRQRALNGRSERAYHSQQELFTMYRNAKKRIKAAALRLSSADHTDVQEALITADALAHTLPPLQRLIRSALHDKTATFTHHQEQMLRLAMRLCSTDVSPPRSLLGLLLAASAHNQLLQPAAASTPASVSSLGRACSMWRQSITKPGLLSGAALACHTASAGFLAGDVSCTPFVAVRAMAALQVVWLVDMAIGASFHGVGAPHPEACLGAATTALAPLLTPPPSPAAQGLPHARPMRQCVSTVLHPLMQPDAPMDAPAVLRAVHSAPLLWPQVHAELNKIAAHTQALGTGHPHTQACVPPAHSTPAAEPPPHAPVYRIVPPFPLDPTTPHDSNTMVASLTSPFYYPPFTHLVRTAPASAQAASWDDELVAGGGWGGVPQKKGSRGRLLAAPTSHYMAARSCVVASAIVAGLQLKGCRQGTRSSPPPLHTLKAAAAATDGVLRLSRCWSHDVRVDMSLRGGLRSFLAPPGKLVSGPSHWGRSQAKNVSDAALLHLLAPSHCKGALRCVPYLSASSLLDMVVWHRRVASSPALLFAQGLMGGGSHSPAALQRLSSACTSELHRRTVVHLRRRLMQARLQLWLPLLRQGPHTVTVPPAVLAEAGEPVETRWEDEDSLHGGITPGFEGSIVLQDLRLMSALLSSLPPCTSQAVQASLETHTAVQGDHVLCNGSLLTLPSCSLTGLVDAMGDEQQHNKALGGLAQWVLQQRADMLRDVVQTIASGDLNAG